MQKAVALTLENVADLRDETALVEQTLTPGSPPDSPPPPPDIPPPPSVNADDSDVELDVEYDDDVEEK